MSERMTDDEAGRHFGTVIAASHADVRTKAAVALSKEIARAHVSEDQKDAVIKALANALEANGRTSPEFADSAWHTHDCWENRRASCSKACVATVAALRLAGRL